MNLNKSTYLESSIWGLTIEPALKQHKLIYNVNSTPGLKLKFKKYLHEEVQTIFIGYNLVEPVTRNQHAKNIVKLSNASSVHSHILENERLNIGTCQKILNLYLKQMWCAGILHHEPPDFPIDRIILKRIGIKDINWTEITQINEYKNIIAKAEEYVNKNMNGYSLAQFELEAYNEYLSR